MSSRGVISQTSTVTDSTNKSKFYKSTNYLHIILIKIVINNMLFITFVDYNPKIAYCTILYKTSPSVSVASRPLFVRIGLLKE